MSSRGLLNCESFEDRIHQILDDRLILTGDELLMEHAARCASCEQMMAEFDSLDDSVKLLPSEIADILNSSEFGRQAEISGNPILSRPMLILTSLAALIVIALNVIHEMDSPASNQSNQASMSVSSSQLAFSTPVMNSDRIPDMAVPRRQRPTPDTSPFSPNFSVANSMPSINLPHVPTWDDISDSLDPLEPVFSYSARIPAIRPVHCSLNVTLDLLKRFSKPQQNSRPDLGFAIDPDLSARA